MSSVMGDGFQGQGQLTDPVELERTLAAGPSAPEPEWLTDPVEDFSAFLFPPPAPEPEWLTNPVKVERAFEKPPFDPRSGWWTNPVELERDFAAFPSAPEPEWLTNPVELERILAACPAGKLTTVGDCWVELARVFAKPPFAPRSEWLTNPVKVKRTLAACPSVPEPPWCTKVDLALRINTPDRMEYDARKESPFEFNTRKPGDYTGTYAVTFADAHACWGWGTVGAADGNAAEAPAQLTEDDAIDIEGVILYWIKFTDVPPQSRPAWADRHKAILRSAVNDYNRIHGRGGQAHYARRLRLKPARVWKLIEEPKSEPKAAPQNAFTVWNPGKAESNSGTNARMYCNGKEVTKNKSRFAA